MSDVPKGQAGLGFGRIFWHFRGDSDTTARGFSGDHAMTISRILVLVALVWGAVPAAAHHSAAVYDHTKQDVAQGTVKEFIYANPHATLVVISVRDGIEKEMRFEMDGPSNLMR